MTSRVYSLVKSIVSWTIATVVVCAGIGTVYYIYRGNEELRARVELELAKAYPNQTVTVGSARLLQGEGLQLREVSVVQPSSGRSSRVELAYVHEATLYCTPTLEQLMKGKVNIQRVSIRGLSLFPQRFRDGTWNVASLIPVKQADHRMPIIAIEDAQIQVSDHTGTRTNVTVFRDIQATITPPHLNPKRNDAVAIEAKFANEHVKSIDLAASVNPHSLAWAIEGKAVGLVADANLFRRLLPEYMTPAPNDPKRHELISMVNGFRGELNLESFSIAKHPSESIPQFHVKGVFANGRFDAPRFLANPITDIAAESFEIIYQPGTVGWQIRNVSAAYGRSPITLNFVHSDSLAPDGDVQIVGNIRNLNATRELVGLLSPKLQELWLKYEFLGRINVDQFNLSRRNGQWGVDTDVTCLDASLNCVYFPYPVHHAEGKISYRHKKSFDIDLTATTNLSPNPTHVLIRAKIKKPGRDFTGEIAVDSHGWMRLDEQLREAVGPKARQVLTDLDARGEVTFKCNLTRRAGEPLKKDIAIDVRNAGAKYVTFPYPLQISQGRIRVTDDLWTFRDFVGQNDSCIVHASGNWYPNASNAPTPSNFGHKKAEQQSFYQRSAAKPPAATSNSTEGGELQAQFIATNIPCDAELRTALPAGPEQIWRSLRPAGHVDYAKIDLVHRHGMKEPQINVLVKQLPTEPNVDRRGLEIRPTWFPLDMRRVTGEVKYNANGTFSIDNMRAQHGPQKRSVSLRSSGEGEFRSDGTWEVLLNRIHADGFETTPEITHAMPASLASALRSLQFNSRLSINGQMHFAGSSQPNSFVNADWKALVGIDNGNFKLGNHNVSNIFGQVSVTGQQRPQGTVNWGRASVASLMFKGLQVTNLETPYQMDNQRLVYGANAHGANDQTTPKKSPHLVAQLFGGTALAGGQVQLTDEYPFQVQFSLNGFNIAQVARDFAMPANMTGRGDANLSMSGNSEGTHTWKGQGGVKLRDANLAKLPALLSLVNELRNRTRPDVFTASDIQFDIDGAYVNLQQFDLHGASLSMKGKGWIAMDRRVELAFYTLLGGEENWLRSALPLAKRMSEQWWQIGVTGTLDNLDWTSKPLPALNEFFLDPTQTAGRNRGRTN